jgi:hypothetical protein
MFEEIEATIKTLNDSSAGWVNRRDAAVALGEYARRATAALHSRADEEDVDVRRGVEEALKSLGSPGPPAPVGRAPSAATVKPAPPTMKELAQACHRKSRREVRPDGEGFVVRVRLKDDRTQEVRIARHKRPDGHQVIRVSTECGAADDKSIAWAIRSNDQFLYCAFCLVSREDGEHLSIVSNFDPDLVQPEMVKNAVKEIAYYGDWLEKKLSGEDRF